MHFAKIGVSATDRCMPLLPATEMLYCCLSNVSSSGCLLALPEIIAMKAALVESAGTSPVYRDFEEPEAGNHEVLVDVTAAPLSQVTRARASGTHYSSSTVFPFVTGIDGVGRRRDNGQRTYFFLPRAPFGSMAERAVVRESLCVPLPDAIDDVTAAALAIPAMSSWASLTVRTRFSRGDVVLINGATGISGRLAVQIASYLGAGKIIVTGRNGEALDGLGALGADVAISVAQDGDALDEAFRHQFANGVDIVLDYLWGSSAERLLAAASSQKNQRPVRFVQLGSASGAAIALPYAALRSSPLELVGCGLGSISLETLLTSVAEVLMAAAANGFAVPTRTVPLAAIESHWSIDSPAARMVFITDGHTAGPDPTSRIG